MPETPDFERLVDDRLADSIGPFEKDSVAALLVEIWNARGAADIVASNAVTGEFGFDIPSAIRSLDVESHASVREPQ